jgi:hypothetical protein
LVPSCCWYSGVNLISNKIFFIHVCISNICLYFLDLGEYFLLKNCDVLSLQNIYSSLYNRNRRCRNRNIVGSRSWRGVLDTTLCDKICQWLSTGRWFSLSTPVSSPNKSDRHDIIEILLKVALNTITPTHWIINSFGCPIRQIVCHQFQRGHNIHPLN